MEEDNTPLMTPFDHMVSGHHLQMIKAAIPYVPKAQQRFIAVYVKYLELQNTIAFFNQEEDQLSACSLGSNTGTFMDMLNDMKKYCAEDQREMFDSAINMMQMMQMYQTYQETMKQMNPNGEENSGGGNPMDMLKALLPPEQQSMMETYSAMFQAMNQE